MVCMSIVFLPDTESNTLPFISISVSVSMLLASIPTTRTSLPAGLGTKYGSDCPNVRHPTEILPTGLCSVHNLIQKVFNLHADYGKTQFVVVAYQNMDANHRVARFLHLLEPSIIEDEQPRDGGQRSRVVVYHLAGL